MSTTGTRPADVGGAPAEAVPTPNARLVTTLTAYDSSSAVGGGPGSSSRCQLAERAAGCRAGWPSPSVSSGNGSVLSRGRKDYAHQRGHEVEAQVGRAVSAGLTALLTAAAGRIDELAALRKCELFLAPHRCRPAATRELLKGWQHLQERPQLRFGTTPLLTQDSQGELHVSGEVGRLVTLLPHTTHGRCLGARHVQHDRA
eukprot:4022990-Prymnesium_polylepis.1